MKAIIFGINSQDGLFLRDILVSKGIQVVGVSRSVGSWENGDVSDLNFVKNIIKKEIPHYIFHLAANSTTKHDALFENHETISTGTLNILESVKTFSSNTKVFIVGSGVQFKNSGKPIKETDEFEATNPYSVSRIQSVYAARYFRTLGIKTYVGYLFHHESPFRKEHHISKLTTDFIKKINPQVQNKLKLGDINVQKEWGYAKDIAEGIFTLVNQEKVWEAAIGTGKVYSIREWLNICFTIKGLQLENYIESLDTQFKAEYNFLQSNPETIFSLGWRPKTDIEQLAQIMMK